MKSGLFRFRSKVSSFLNRNPQSLQLYCMSRSFAVKSKDDQEPRKQTWQDKFVEHNLTKTNEEFKSIKDKLENDLISLYEFPQLLRSKAVIGHYGLLIMILNAFMKKLYKNEGIIETEDDVFRSVYRLQRSKIKVALTGNEQVQDAVKLLFLNLDKLSNDKLVSFFNFITKGQIQINESQLKLLMRSFKISLMAARKNPNKKLLLASIAIFSKSCQKFLVDLRFSKDREEHVKILKDILVYCKEIVEEDFQEIGVTDACMITKAFSNFDLVDADLIMNLLQVVSFKYDLAQNRDLYGLLDATLDAFKFRFDSLEQVELHQIRKLLQVIISRIQLKEQYKLRPFEICGFAKNIGNKRGILPPSIPEVQQFLDLLMNYLQENLDKMELADITYAINAFHRYQFDIPKELGLQLAERIKTYATSGDRIKLSGLEIYRILVVLLHMQSTFGVEACQLLMKNYLERVEKSDLEKYKTEQVVKQMKTLLTRVKQTNFKLDNDTYTRMRQYIQTNSTY